MRHSVLITIKIECSSQNASLIIINPVSVGIKKWKVLPQKWYSKTFSKQFLAQKQISPPNIRVDRNCQPTWVTQNAIPEEQELILLGGGHSMPPPLQTQG